MKCAQIHPNLAAFVVGGLEPEEAAEVEDHLASCPGCTNELRELQKVNRALDAAPPPATPPAYLKDEILSRVRAEGLSTSNTDEPEEPSPSEERTGSSRTFRFDRFKDLRIILPSAAAAIVAILALGIVFGLLREEPPVATIQLLPTPRRPPGLKDTGV
jgi:anti-sigma factor RsiW